MRVLLLLLLPCGLVLAAPVPQSRDTATCDCDLGVLPLPKAMERYADAFLDQDVYGGNPLPAGLTGEAQIIQFIASLKFPHYQGQGQWVMLERYRYRDCLLLTIQVEPDQKRGEPRNLAHMIVVKPKQRSYFGILLSRT